MAWCGTRKLVAAAADESDDAAEEAEAGPARPLGWAVPPTGAPFAQEGVFLLRHILERGLEDRPDAAEIATKVRHLFASPLL